MNIQRLSDELAQLQEYRRYSRESDKHNRPTIEERIAAVREDTAYIQGRIDATNEWNARNR